MPQNSISNTFMRPFVVLALPGMYLFYKYSQYKRRRKEIAKRRLTERELQHLNTKIEKLLTKLEESEPELANNQEEECVICINAKATMQTVPCGHQVVCRKCFVKTIQIAVSQRLLPLRCVICRAKILRLKTGPILPTSASGYSVNSRISSVPQSDSLYSVSSGDSSISSASCSSDTNTNYPLCCGGRCMGAYPRQPLNGTIRKTQHSTKVRLQEYCHLDKSNIHRLPPIWELPGASPTQSTSSNSTRIRCAQKIVTQLETVSILRKKKTKYEKLQQDDYPNDLNINNEEWWSPNKENIDNRKNEITEKHIEKNKERKQHCN